MAQLGDLVRARALLRRAAQPSLRGGGGPCAVRRRRGRDRARLTRPRLAESAGRGAATLEAHDDRVNAAYARYLEVRRLLLIGRIDEADARSPISIPRLSHPRRGRPTSWWWRGSRFRRLRTKAARGLARARLAAHRAHPALTAEVESAHLALHAPAARLVADGEASPPARGGRGVAGVEGLGRGRVPSCRPPCRQVVPLARRPVLFALARALGKRGLATCRGTRWSRGPSDRRSPTIHIERGCASRSGGCAPCFGRWPRCARRSEGSRWRRGRARGRSMLAPPVEGEHGRVLAFLADGESWSTRPSRWRLEPAHRPAGARLPRGSRQGAVVWPGASPALDDATRAGIHDDIVTPPASAHWLGWFMSRSSAEIVREYGPFPGWQRAWSHV